MSAERSLLERAWYEGYEAAIRTIHATEAWRERHKNGAHEPPPEVPANPYVYQREAKS